MTPNHLRNVRGMHAAPRCEAKSGSGRPCQNPAVKRKKRCHVHGGKGSQGKNYRKESNGYKSAYLQLEQQVNAQLRRIDKVIRKMERSGEAARAREELLSIRGTLNQLTRQKQADLALSYEPPEAEREAQRDQAVMLDARRQYTAAGHRSLEMIRDRARGAMVGLAVGEAIGLTLSGCRPGSFRVIDSMRGGGPTGVKAGQWAGDTAMALALMESLTYRHGFDETDFMERLLEWRDEGEYSCTRTCVGMGDTTRDALARYERTGDPVAGETRADCLANGSLARTAPAAIRYWKQRVDLLDVAIRQSLTTHAGPGVVQACAGLADILADAISGLSREAVLTARDAYDPLSLRPILVGAWTNKSSADVRGSDNALTSLEAALWCVGKTTTFEEAVLKAVNLGEDAGSTGAVTGQVAGALYGACAIPSQWIEQLAWHDKLVEMTDVLFKQSRARGKARR